MRDRFVSLSPRYWLRETPAILVIGVLLLLGGWATYELTDKPDTARTAVTARITGFAPVEGRSRYIVGSPVLRIVAVMPDGQRQTFTVDAVNASQCRAGDSVTVYRTANRAGFDHFTILPKPCS